MVALLEKEGIEVKNDQVVNFKLLYWDPAVELEDPEMPAPTKK